jgi:EmrB/QacA subfamily drug resistance transporter
MQERDELTPPADTAANGNGDGAVAVAATPEAAEAAAAPRPGRFANRSDAWILAVCCVAQFMVILDLSIVNVALPSIQFSLSFSSAELQWVVDAYAIAFAGFLMLGGRVADRWGQRRTFVAALVLFSAASLAGGAAPNREMLIAARGLQGFSCAFMAASSLAIITSSFEPGPKLHRAIGLWAAMNGAGGAAGVFLGGVITQELSWRWVLLINPPIGLAAALIAWAVVADRRRAPEARFDLAGAITLTGGQVILVYGVVEAGLRGWSSAIALGPIIGGIAVLIAFCVIEARFAEEPLVPFKALTKPLKDANTIVLLFSAAIFPMWYLASLYLQQVLGLSPLKTGLTFLPMTLMIMLVARNAGKLVTRFGVRTVLGSGLTLMAVGFLLLTKIASGGSAIVYIMIPGLLAAAGIAMSIVPSTIAATQGAKQGQQGLASGMVNTSRQVGGGLGIAILVTLATTRTSDLIGGGQAVPQALTEGFRLGFYIGAGLCVAAAIATFAWIPKPDDSQAPRARRIQFATAIGLVLAAFVGLDFGVGGSHAAPLGAYTLKDSYNFASAPGLHPPIIKTDTPTATSKLTPGYIFLGAFYDVSFPPERGQSGPLIVDNKLQPVWFKPVPTSVVASNLSLQSYEGKPVLAWWQGIITKTGEIQSGVYKIVDQHYRPIATLRGKNGWIPTIHELVIRGHDAWVTANRNIPRDLGPYGGAYNGALVDSAVEEYDLRTGKLLYHWDALDHIPLGDGRASIPTNGFPWDAYHVNSISVPGDGSFIVSMRNTWAVYKVNIATGKIDWELGGRHSDFKFAHAADFQWQHDVVVYPNSPYVTMFDDHCCQITGGGTYVTPSAPSRGLVLKLNQQTHTASLAGEYSHGAGFDADYMGSTQPLQGGNELVGWGSAPFFSEYDASGRMLMDAVFPGHDLSYRAMLEQWVGQPTYPPSGAARHQGGKTVVYASWNGATQVASWRVLAAPGGGGRLTAASTVPKSGFETAIQVPASDGLFRVQALDANGRVLGTSRPFSAGS